MIGKDGDLGLSFLKGALLEPFFNKMYREIAPKRIPKQKPSLCTKSTPSVSLHGMSQRERERALHQHFHT